MKKNHEPDADNRGVSRWVLVAWVGFLSACLLEGLVFSVVDPGEVHWSGHMPQPGRQGVYTAAFFCFWFIGTASARLVLWLAEPAGLSDIAVD